MMLGDQLRGAMSTFRLEKADEEALRVLLKRHRERIHELTEVKQDVLGTES